MAPSVRTIYEQKKTTRLKFRLSVLATVLLLAAGGLAYLAFEKQIFEFTDIHLEGAASLTREELLGSEGPISFFTAVRIAHPAVLKATIHRDYLNRVLRIEITERERFGVWCSDASALSSACFWFDRDGALFAPAPRAEGTLVRLVNDRTGRVFSPGARALAPTQFAHLLRAFELLEQVGLNRERVVIEDLENEEAYADLVYGPRVFFSLRNDPIFAYEPLLSLQKELHKLEYVDLRVDQRIFLKYR